MMTSVPTTTQKAIGPSRIWRPACVRVQPSARRKGAATAGRGRVLAGYEGRGLKFWLAGRFGIDASSPAKVEVKTGVTGREHHPNMVNFPPICRGKSEVFQRLQGFGGRQDLLGMAIDLDLGPDLSDPAVAADQKRHPKNPHER